MQQSIYIQNLKCGGCANTIKKALLKLQGIEQINIDVEDNRIDLESKSSWQQEEVESTLLRLGYPTQGSDNNLISKAKSYASCAIGRIGEKVD